MKTRNEHRKGTAPGARIAARVFPLLAVLALSGVFTSLAHAQGPEQSGQPFVLADSNLDGEIVSEATLGTMRARYVESSSPETNEQKNGVILWDEVGSIGRPKDRNNHSSGSGNSQSNTLQLGPN